MSLLDKIVATVAPPPFLTQRFAEEFNRYAGE
jgi:hypothetical protein